MHPFFRLHPVLRNYGGLLQLSRQSYSGCFINRDNLQKDYIQGKNGLLQITPNHLPQIRRKSLIETPKKSTTTLIISGLKNIGKSPTPALVLGICGLIPFAAAPTYLICSHSFVSEIARAQVIYGATILSFLGGVRWGYSLPEHSELQPDWTNIGVSVAPSLLAWGALLTPDIVQLCTVTLGLLGVGYYDLVTPGYPEWFKGLRILLTSVAVLCLYTTLMCRLMLNEKPKVEESEVEATSS